MGVLPISLFILYQLTISLAADDEIIHMIAKINENGFPESLLYEAAGFKDKPVDKIELARKLEKRDVQKAIVKAAMKYSSEMIDTEAKEKLKNNFKRKSWTDYCSYSWLKWFPFSGCETDNESAGNEEESENNYTNIKDNKCYKKHISDD